MSLNTDLQTLKTNIEGVKSTLYTNLTNKGVTNISETDTLSTLADKVSTITTGGGSGGSGIDFSSIGYDAEFSAELNAKINADIAYSKTLLDAWNPSNTSAYLLYQSDKKLVYAPNIDTSNVNKMQDMFNGCTILTTVPEYNTSNVTDMLRMFNGCNSLISVPLFDTSKVNKIESLFNGCHSLKTVPAFDTSKVSNMDSMFSDCKSLKTVPAFDTSNVTRMERMFFSCSELTSLPAFDTSKVTTFYYMLYGCNNLKIIGGLSFKSFSDSTMSNYYMFGFYSNTSLRKAVLKDIGYQSTAVQFNTSNIPNWGVNTDEIPDARQSLIDSLITYSFDRASAGYPTCEITLSTNTKALLTSDEIAQITAKGFTLA